MNVVKVFRFVGLVGVDRSVAQNNVLINQDGRAKENIRKNIQSQKKVWSLEGFEVSEDTKK